MEYGFNQEERVFAAMKIQTYWRSHQDKILFQLMSLTVRAAEHCLAPAILRQLSPREADLVRDPSMHCKVRFRFSGSQFPPVIVFKIFHLGGGRQYISGKRVFLPSNQATTDTCRMMGNRIFINHIIADEIQRQGRMISDTSYITCMRDFMQWDSLEVGGKDTVADRLRQEMLLLAPQIPCPLIGGAIPPRMLRSPAAPPSSVVSTARHASQPATSSTSLPSTRRSARARTTAARMRHLYILGGTLKDENNEITEKNHNPERGEQEKDMEGSVVKPEAPQIVLPLGLEEDSSEDSLSDSEWEEEAEKLCLWTRQLALDDMDNVQST
ncbi:uncharacterized protein CXorf58 homolog isoform 3-T3 [Salvelinus alpinus]